MNMQIGLQNSLLVLLNLWKIKTNNSLKSDYGKRLT